MYEVGDGATATVAVTVKHVNEKVLPEIDDELARSATEFDTLAEWRTDVEGRIREALDDEIETAFRAAAVDELVTASNVQGAGPLVEARARELLNGFLRSLSNRGIAPDAYFQVTGQTPELLTAQIRAEAAHSVARELALEAVAEKAGIEVTDDDVKAVIREQAEAAGDDPERGDRGRLGARAPGVAPRGPAPEGRRSTGSPQTSSPSPIEQAAERDEQRAARESIWTPDKEKAEAPKKLWTPGSEES